MDNNQKKFSLYVFLSTFSRNLIEVFIPIVLYKFGYSIKEVLFYYFLVNVFSLVLTYPFIKISQKYNNRFLAIIGCIAFVVVQVMLNYLQINLYYLIAIALIYAIYRRGYWIARRYYTLKTIKKDKISTTYSLISIFNQIGKIVAVYIGSLLLDFVSIKVETIIAIILFLLSTIPLYLIKFKTPKDDKVKIELRKHISEIPKTNLYLFGSYELINVVNFLFPLYIFIYVKNTYQTVGIVSLITYVSVILFTYIYGKKLDNSKNNYIKASIILSVLVYVLKANSTWIFLFIISFIEGIVSKMYEQSISKEFYTLSKKFEYINYNLVYEIMQNLFRSVATFILLIVNVDFKYMIYIVLFFIFIGVFMKFKQPEMQDYKIEEVETKDNK